MIALPAGAGRPALMPRHRTCSAPEATDDLELDVAVLRLASEPAAASAGRRFVAGHLRAWGLDDLIEPCELVTSELVTNSVIATGGGRSYDDGPPSIVLRLRLTARRLICEVWDRSDRPPRPAARRRRNDLDEHGRGLHLVSAACTDWTFRVAPAGGKIVQARWDLTC